MLNFIHTMTSIKHVCKGLWVSSSIHSQWYAFFRLFFWPPQMSEEMHLKRKVFLLLAKYTVEIFWISLLEESCKDCKLFSADSSCHLISLS